MITIHLGKQRWMANGHAPKYLCFCVSRMMDLISLSHGATPSMVDGLSIVDKPRGTLRTAAETLFHSLAANHPRHVKVISDDADWWQERMRDPEFHKALAAERKRVSILEPKEGDGNA